ncbi:MAG: glycosyltransferase family 4 protein [Patescibacteria group bacterium]|nr:glycosyltransferase family 4 protein [Patescibacteria group bacterium]
MFVKEVVERLAGEYDFTIISARLDKKLPKFEQRDKFKYYRVGIGSSFDKWLYPIFAVILAKKLKPDLVHAVMESYAGIALWLFSIFNKKITTILTLQSGDLDDPSKKIPAFLWKRIHSTPDLVTAISSSLAERAKKLRTDQGKVVIIPNGVDLELAKQSQAEPIPGRIVCVARLSWEKGLDYLIKSLPSVFQEFPNAHLVMVGEGNKRQEIERMIKELNLGSRVTLLGKLPHEETLREMGKAQIFICPSLAEGLGIVFIEAQACGAPVIGTRVGGIPDVISDNQTGLLIAPRDSEAIAAAIKRLLSDQELRERLRNNAFQGLGRFNWDKVVRQVSGEYDKYLK